MNENDVIIDVKDLHKSYGQTEVIKGVDMTVRKGEVICIIGPSGAGKSTTLNTVAGLLHSRTDSNRPPAARSWSTDTI